MSLGRRISRTVALLRYHRPSQFAWRLYRMAQRHVRSRLPERFFFKTSPFVASWKPNARSEFLRISDRRSQLWPLRSVHAPKMAEGRFTYLGETRNLEPQTTTLVASINWNPEAPRLWRFHLQCHEDLLELADAKGQRAAFRLIESWLCDPRHQSPTGDPDAWHPFCISRRLPVWLSLAAKYDLPDDLQTSFWKSVGAQVGWLERNCEWDLGGNHLLENLTALYLARSFLDIEDHPGDPSIENRLIKEFEEQVLPTGEHSERVPTYHALMIVCVVQCVEAANFANSRCLETLQTIAHRMVEFARWLRQPDGNFPLLSDSSLEETPDLDKLFAWSDEVSRRKSDLSFDPSPDYWIHQTDHGDRLLFDTGPLACDHIPAHGHADLLQVTATLAGRDAIVDTGNFQYEPGQMRLFCRATAAHNVMQIGDREQCDLWSSFRMGRRGHPSGIDRGRLGEYQWCSAMHDGFDCPSGRLILCSDWSWTILDWFSQFHGKTIAMSRLHWHPDWQLEMDDSGRAASAHLVDAPDRRYRISALQQSGELSLHDGFYCPNFGEKISNQILVNQNRFASAGWLGICLSLDDSHDSSPLMISSEGMRLSISTAGSESIAVSMEDGAVVVA